MNVCEWAHEDQRACGYLTPSFFALLLLGTVSHQQAPVILLSQQAGFTDSHKATPNGLVILFLKRGC